MFAHSIGQQMIKGYPMYFISREGLITSQWRNKKLKHHDNAGYLMVFLKRDKEDKGHWKYVHRLLAIQFIAIPEHLKDYKGELWVNHKDGNKSNNQIDNLEWSTISENIQHSFTVLGRKTKMKRGKDHPLFGTHRSEASKLAMSEAKKGCKHPKYKGNYITPAGVFDSSYAAAAPNNTYSKKVYRYCHQNKPGWSFELI